MATPNLISNLGAGDTANFNRGMSNVGIPVMNNQGTPSTQGPSSGGPGGIATPIMGQPFQPITEPGGTITRPAGMSSGIPTFAPVSGVPGFQALTSPTGGTLLPTNAASPTGVVPSTTTNPAAPFGNLSAQQQQELNKQLVDIFGKGEGNLLDSLIGSIGGSDDAYMQAYQKAIAGPNAENLATLLTSLGNSGVSADSSTSAIAQADFASNIAGQEGLQLQQLKQNDLSQLMSLVQGLQGGSASEVSSGGFLNDLASITSSIGNLIPFGSGGNKGNAGNVGVSGAQAQAGLSQGTINYESQPLGEGAIPLTPTDTSNLPGLDSASIDSFIGAGVFI